MRSLYVDNYIINTPILEIIRKLQLTLTNGKLKDCFPRGDEIVVTCPHHNNGRETTPAANIYIGEDPKIPYGFIHCFACDFKGSFAKFVGECFDRTEDYGKKWLIENYGELAFEKQLNLEAININKSKIQKRLDPSELNNYQEYCPYLQKRKISREICEMFSIKYDSIKRQVVFPCYDEKDNLVMFVRRSVDYKAFFMDKEVNKPLYCLNYIIKHNYQTAIITEGPFDCLYSWENGYPAMASLGTISDRQIDLISNSCIKTLYLMFDNDAKGRMFTEHVKRRLNKRILTVDVQLPSNRKDINELTAAEFEECIKQAQQNNRI